MLTRYASISFLLLFFLKTEAQNFSSKEVTIKTPDTSVTLAGTLLTPKGKGHFPAILLIQGNGPHTRDDSISGSPLFKQFAEYFAEKGAVVLRVDKRGFGKSTGNVTRSEGNYTTLDLAKDFTSAYEFLNKQPLVDTARVGVIGHSEGGLISSILASQLTDLDWIVTVASPAVRGDSIVAEQSRFNRKQLGMDVKTSVAIDKVWLEYLQFIKDGYSSETEYLNIGKQFLMAHGLPEDDSRITPKFIDQLLDEYKSPWYKYYFATDPADFIKSIDIPYLGIFGGNDDQVTVEQNLVPLHKTLSSANNKVYKIVVLSDEDHFFARCKDQRLKKHEYGKMELSSRLLKTIEAWLLDQKILESM